MDRNIVVLACSLLCLPIARCGGSEPLYPLLRWAPSSGIELPLTTPFEKAGYQNVSLVRVSESSREVLSYKRPRKGAEAKPARVKLLYRIDEVLLGEQGLAGQEVETTAIETSVMSKRPEHTYWIPKQGDSGVWAVGDLEGKRRCVRGSLLGINLPAYQSNVHQRWFAWQKGTSDYKSLLELCKAIATYKNSQDKSAVLSAATGGSNPLVRRWAIWQSWVLHRDAAAGELLDICEDKERSCVLQAIADAALMESSQQGMWRFSETRKRMIGEWLLREDRQYEELVYHYLGDLTQQWVELGYSRDILDLQVRSAYDNPSLSWRKQRLLKSHFRSAFTEPIEVDLPTE